MITMKENMCGSVNTRCLQSIASKCSVYQTNFNFFDQTKILSTCYYLKTIVLCIATIYTRNLMRNA